MKTFLDKNGNKVELSFSEHAFDEPARHVLVICQYEGEWLLTKHKMRGFEFPGGKMEAGESLEDTAYREVYEETGLTIENPVLCGIKEWQNDESSRNVELLYKTNRFSVEPVSSDEGDVFWIDRDDIIDY
jgi:8-oxo-dGTP diphosphatase